MFSDTNIVRDALRFFGAQRVKGRNKQTQKFDVTKLTLTAILYSIELWMIVLMEADTSDKLNYNKIGKDKQNRNNCLYCNPFRLLFRAVLAVNKLMKREWHCHSSYRGFRIRDSRTHSHLLFIPVVDCPLVGDRESWIRKLIEWRRCFCHDSTVKMK